MNSFARPESLLIASAIGSGTFLGGSETLLREEPAIASDSWDTLTLFSAIRRATLSAEDLAALHPMGQRLGQRTWWLTAAKPTHHSPGVWLIELNYKGWATVKPPKCSSSDTLSQRSETVDVAAVPPVPDSYFTDQNGQNVLVPGTPGAPAYSYIRYIYERSQSYTGIVFTEDAAAVVEEDIPPPGSRLAWGEPSFQRDILPGTTAGMVTIVYPSSQT